MKRKTFFIFLLLSACSTGYQPEGFFTNGYSDHQMEPNRFVIRYRANEHTPPETVMAYALQRASEVARKAGFSYFAITEVARSGSSKVRLHYPSLELTIECFHTQVAGKDLIDCR